MKPINELKNDFKEFYNKLAKPLLAEYELNRKADRPVVLSLYFFLFSFFGTILISFVWNSFLIYGFVLTCIAFAIFAYISSHSKSNSVVSITRGGEKTVCTGINTDYEMYLKTVLMPDFLKIFSSDLSWFKPGQALVDMTKQTNLLNSLKIFPDTKMFAFDDCFIGKIEGLPVQILELQTGLKLGPLGVLFNFPLLFANCANLAKYIKIYMFVNVVLLLSSRIFPILGIFAVLMGLLMFPSIWIYLAYQSYKIAKSSAQLLAISYDVPKNFISNTIIVESAQSNMFGIKSTAGLEKVILEDVRFNKSYKVYSNDQVEARYMLTTGFIERFNNIKTAFHAKFIRGEFKNGKLVLLIGVDKDLFKMGHINEQTTYMTFLELFSEFYSVLSLAEQLNLDSDTKL